VKKNLDSVNDSIFISHQHVGYSILTTVCILATVGSAYKPWCINISPAQIFVFELFPIDAHNSCSVAILDVTSLDHELVNDTVEGSLRIGQAIVFAGA
jgi:hypothetical protein